MTPKLVNFDLPTTGQFSAAVDIHGISITVWNYGRTRPATPKPRR